VDRACATRAGHRWWRAGWNDHVLLRTLLATEWCNLGRHDRPYSLLPLGHSKPCANSIAYSANALADLEEREGHPFASRLISDAHLTHLREFSQLSAHGVPERPRSNAMNDL